MAQGGTAVARMDGQVVFVSGACANETVRVAIDQRRSGFLRGHVVEVIAPSADRIAPTVTPGDHVPWQHIAYPAQLRYKQQIVREQLAKFLPGQAPEPLPILAADRPWGYRNSADLHISGAVLGYHSGGTRETADQTHDPLLLPALDAALQTLRSVPFADRISAVRLRASAAYGYVLAELTPADGVDPDDLAETALAWQLCTPQLAGVTAADGTLLVGADELFDELGGMLFRLDVRSFFQVNPAQAERLIALIRDWFAAGGEHLLDAYSGVGAFALPLAKLFQRVTAVEVFSPAVADGKLSAELNGCHNVTFVRGDAERVVGRLSGPFDAVVLDPPRRGCHPALISALIAHAPQRIAAVFCHPGLIGRDLQPLLAAGYQIVTVQPIDLFPQTPHIETLVLLQRSS
jgi:23S rRNA (uracil1939-C5)-methyltransferase